MGLRTGFVLVVLVFVGTGARASRPLIRTALAIRNLQMSMPTPVEAVTKSEAMGIDREPLEVRKRFEKFAVNYLNLKSGRQGARAFEVWVETCDAKSGQLDENPFCRIEQERKLERAVRLAASSVPTEKTVSGALLADALRDGNFAAANGLPASVLGSAIRALDASGDLDRIAGQLSNTDTCYATSLNYLVGYKLEERFPAEEIVDLTRKVYRRGSNCAARGDYYGAQASFRYGLIQIWKKDYSEIPALMAKVEASPEASAFHPRAKYWRYYSATQVGNESARKAAREALLKDHPLTFQNLAAGGDEAGRPNVILQSAVPMMAFRSIVHTELNPLLRGVEALIKLKADQLAADVLERSVGDVAMLEPEVRLYSALLMHRVGFSLPKFKILSSLFQDMPAFITRETMRLFFPVRYAEFLNTGETDLDPLLVLSLIRQESAFNNKARSQVGARGLMQVMPATARMVASVRKNRLFDPATNIHVGTKYLAQRLRQYDGDVELTLAAYNAGFARVDEWKKRYPTDNRILFLDFIPFRETRDYVSSILRNYYWYVRLYDDSIGGRAPTSVASGRGTTTPASNTSNKISAILNARSGMRVTEAEPPK